jgi:lactoylglutathione lyase
MSNGALGALGIGVSDLDRSVDFYTRVLGMQRLMTFTLPDMDEVLVGYHRRRGPALALMHFTDGSDPSYADLPVKVVVYVPDPPAVADAIRAEGLEVTREPTPVPELGDAVVGLAKDPDGYVIELLQRPPRPGADAATAGTTTA